MMLMCFVFRVIGSLWAVWFTLILTQHDNTSLHVLFDVCGLTRIREKAEIIKTKSHKTVFFFNNRNCYYPFV